MQPLPGYKSYFGYSIKDLACLYSGQMVRDIDLRFAMGPE